MPRLLCFFLIVFVFSSADRLLGQATLDAQLQGVEGEISASERDLLVLEAQAEAVRGKIEELKLLQCQLEIERLGLPSIGEGEEVIFHRALALSYSEAHEQARWVAHVILPDVIEGNVSRSNDFREDTLVSTGSAQEADYFLKYEQPDDSYQYDGYGYDRGHLAPSADFRWSALALSESYLYSNMSPQAPEFNRGRWAELEGYLRAYLKRNRRTKLYVVTGPVLHDSLPKVERSINGLSLPEKFFKVVLDYDQQRAIAFLMPNHEIAYPVETFAVSIDSVEAVTGLDFFPALPDGLEDELEAQRQVYHWLPERQQEDAQPILPDDLPEKSYNTVQARFFADRNEEVRICGTVVDSKLTQNGHTFLNLDKKFPNHIFTVAVWQSNATNFSYQPHEYLLDQRICVTGKIELSRGVPTMEARTEEDIERLDR